MTPTTNPASLGLVLQPDHTAAAVAVGKNLDVGYGDGFFELEFEAVNTTGLVANTGNVFIGGASMNISTGVDVIKTLAPGEKWVFTSRGNAGNPFHANALFLQAATNGDGAMVRGLRR